VSEPHHDAIGFVQDRVKIGEALSALDLRDQTGLRVVCGPEFGVNLPGEDEKFVLAKVILITYGPNIKNPVSLCSSF
jgi:hypothetical protein